MINVIGTRVSFGKVIIRTICRLIPFEVLSFFDDRPVGLHDSFSNTRLLNNNARQRMLCGRKWGV